MRMYLEEELAVVIWDSCESFLGVDVDVGVCCSGKITFWPFKLSNPNAGELKKKKRRTILCPRRINVLHVPNQVLPTIYCSTSWQLREFLIMSLLKMFVLLYKFVLSKYHPKFCEVIFLLVRWYYNYVNTFKLLAFSFLYKNSLLNLYLIKYMFYKRLKGLIIYQLLHFLFIQLNIWNW